MQAPIVPTPAYIPYSDVLSLIRDILSTSITDHDSPVHKQVVRVRGWIRSVRAQQQVHFIALNDGSCFENLQLVLSHENNNASIDFLALKTGVAIEVEGKLHKSPGAKQHIELHVQVIHYLSPHDSEYPLQKKRHSFEMTRMIPHLRVRTNTFATITRIRSALYRSLNHYLHSQGYHWINVPAITTNDCEGAGDLFSVGFDINSSKRHFFGKPAYLSVSGQLNAESYACGMSRVYSFAPIFRADNSNTRKHLSEFWMLEPEGAWLSYHDCISLAENLIKYAVSTLLEHNHTDLELFDTYVHKGIIAELGYFVQTPFKRMEYTEVLKMLKGNENNKNKTHTMPPLEWGMDLATEHEKALMTHTNNVPVAIMNYPKEIKPFYMYHNDDERTVRGIDIIFPRVGELVGGSEREYRLKELRMALTEKKLREEELSWYVDLRRYGTVPHSGFGLGFERLIQFVTGMANIRDCIAFPRAPQEALC